MPIDIRPEDNKSYYEYKIPNEDVVSAIRNALNIRGAIKTTQSGDWNHKILIDISPHKGYNVNKTTGEIRETSLATVHVSNKGIHIVPRKGK